MSGFAAKAEREAADDFTDILSSYAPHKHIESAAKSRELLQIAHRFALLLGQLTVKSGEKKEHERIFLGEMTSDSVHLLHVLMVGDARAAHFYMRSIVENYWRHLFYKDHFVEYCWLHERSGYFNAIETLRDYCKHLPISSGPLRERMANLSNYYSSLSRIVHSTTAPSMTLRENIASISLTVKDSSVIKPFLGNLCRDVLLLASVSEIASFDAMTSAQRSYFLRFLDARRKRERQSALA